MTFPSFLQLRGVHPNQEPDHQPKQLASTRNLANLTLVMVGGKFPPPKTDSTRPVGRSLHKNLNPTDLTNLHPLNLLLSTSIR